MPQSAGDVLGGVAETLLIPLYAMASESARPDALLSDDRAAALVQRLRVLYPRLRGVHVDFKDQVSIVLRRREVDTWTREYLKRCEGAVVAHIGCGLDTRFERVDDGRVKWYDLDLPQVVALRRRLLSGNAPRYRLVAASAFEPSWMDAVAAEGRPLLVVAEGVLYYFAEPKVRSLVAALRGRFPGAELICDVVSPLQLRLHRMRVHLDRAVAGAPYLWALRRATDLEGWADGVRLLRQWFLYDRPEPRLPGAALVRLIPSLGHGWSLTHYRLGSAAT